MAFYEMKWWKKLFERKKRKPKKDSLKDIKTIIEFLKEISDDTKFLIPELEKLEELEKERKVASSGIIQVNLETQVKVLDGILERYEFFQNDADINGLRVKKVAMELLSHSKKAGLKDLVKDKKNDIKWRFEW